MLQYESVTIRWAAKEKKFKSASHKSFRGGSLMTNVKDIRGMAKIVHFSFAVN